MGRPKGQKRKRREEQLVYTRQGMYDTGDTSINTDNPLAEARVVLQWCSGELKNIHEGMGDSRLHELTTDQLVQHMLLLEDLKKEASSVFGEILKLYKEQLRDTTDVAHKDA